MNKTVLFVYLRKHMFIFVSFFVVTVSVAEKNLKITNL